VSKSIPVWLIVVGFMLPVASFSEVINPAAASLADFCAKYPRPEYKSLKRIIHNSDWFELYEVSPGVVAIYEPHQWQEVISYLIEGDEKAILFDTGNGIGDIATLVYKITEKPVTVLNSHTHYDHVGGNYAFDRILGIDTDFTREKQEGIKNAEISIEVSQPALCRPTPNDVNESNHIGRPFQITDTINDGTQIDLGNRIVEVIQVPGHTPDAIALIDRKAGLLWTGDSFYSGPIWLHAPETDLTAYRQSLQRLVKELPDIKALLPAHNTPWVEPSVLIDVLLGFDAMMSGQLIKVPQGEGLSEYRLKVDRRFSFLMRDEDVPPLAVAR